MMEKSNEDCPIRGPYNVTPFKRALILCATKVFQKFKSHRKGGTAVLLPFGFVVKRGKHVNLVEVETIRLVSQNTTIPVPEVCLAFKHVKTGETYVVERRIKGEMLMHVWWRSSEATKIKILQQLRAIVLELREIRAPEGTGVHNVCGGPLEDMKVSWALVPFGPFKTIEDFHYWLRDGYSGSRGLTGPPWDDLNKMLDVHLNGRWPLKFTHADLHHGNIMIDGDHITGIIDWGSAGWFPAYWEYARASIDTLGGHCDRKYVDHWLEPYLKEREAEMTRVVCHEH